MSKVKKKKTKKNIYLIIMSVLLFSFVCFLVLTINLSKKDLETKKKISILDNLYNDIVLLEEQRSTFDKIGNQIDEISYKNKVLNNDIEKLTNSIKDLDEKISRYGK